MTLLKINDTYVELKHDELTSLYFVDIDGQAIAGNSEEEVIQKIKDTGRHVRKHPPNSD